MGTWVLRLVRFFVLSLTALTNVCFTVRTAQTLRDVIQPRSSENNSSRKKADLSGTAKRTIFLTLLSSLCFCLSMLIAVVSYSIQLSFIGWTNDNASQRKVKKSAGQMSGPRIAVIFFQSAAHLTMLLILWLRLQMCFKSSKFALSKFAQRCSGLALISAICSVMTVFILFVIGVNRLITAVLAIPAALLYPSLSFWILCRFLQNTMQLMKHSQSIESNTNRPPVSPASSCTINTPTMSKENSRVRRTAVNQGSDIATNMLIIVLRFTIVTVTAVVSTFIASGFYVLVLAQSNELTLSLRHFAYMLDNVVNSYCLLCTLDSEWYSFVFGRIHDYYIQQLLRPSLVPEMTY